MANYTVTGSDRIKKNAAVRATPKSLPVPKPPVFTAAVDALAPHLNGKLLASLFKSRITALAKKTGLKESDLSTLVAAHKLAAKSNLPADALFALSKDGVQPDVISLASIDIRQLRKKIEVAVKKNIVPSDTLAAFDAAKPSFARIQANETPLKTFAKTYKLTLPASASSLEAKGFKTLSDVRSAGGLAELAKRLKVKPDNTELVNLAAHANLSFLGSDVPTNSVLIKNGYTHLSQIAQGPDGIFVDKLSPVIGLTEALRMQSVARAQTTLSNPKPSVFTAALDALAPHLNGKSIASLSRVSALAKKTGLKESDLTTLVAAHKLAAKTNLPADAIFAIAKDGVQPDVTSLASTDIRQLRKNIESAVKKNVVPRHTLATFYASKPSFARIQTNETPLKTFAKTYKLTLPASARSLEAKGFKTLSDVRSVGGLAELAKRLKVKPDNTDLVNLAAHANLSFLGSDVPTNSALIKAGYKHLSEIAKESDAMFLGRVGSSIGFSEGLRIQTTAKAQRGVLDNYLVRLRADLANGFALDSTSEKVAHRIREIDPPKCDCEDCEAAVSPLAYLADLIGYATTKLGTTKPDVVPLYRLWQPDAAHHFYTRDVGERDWSIAQLKYEYERIACYVFSSQVDGTIPLYQFFNKDFGSHFYTTDKTKAPSGYNGHEGGEIPNVGFIYKNSRGSDASVKLWRFRKDTTHDYFYAIDALNENGDLKGPDKDYFYEGVEGYALREGYSRIAPHELTGLFHQPFSELPLSCDQVDEVVRQVRICIEVLRAFNLQESDTKRAQYCRDTYQALLLKLGTTYTELREAHGDQPDDCQALADQLGIPLGTEQRDYLNELLLDPDTLTELDLERLFGLVDTSRDPLSHGAKLKDSKEQLKRWNLAGVSWGVNTDLDGIVYVSLSKSATTIKVDVYRDSTRTIASLEATGEVDSSESTVMLSPNPANGLSNGLSGEVDVKIQANDDTLSIQVVPQIVSWRLRKLRSQWQEQDWIKDPYSSPPLTKDPLPIIDPDLIGPDDFRDPFGSAGTPFKKFWQKRRKWVDKLLGDLHSNVFLPPPDSETPKEDAFTLLFRALEETEYSGTKQQFWNKAENQLPELSESLQKKSDKAAVEKATKDLWSKFKLTPEMLFRLLNLQKKHDDWVYYDKPKNQSLDDNEWGEVVNILVQAQKSFWYAAWFKEEEPLVLGPSDFWISLCEPEEGVWPPASLEDHIPRIDPETLKLDDLPDETAGAEAIELWNERQDELESFTTTIRGYTRNAAGASNRITAAFSGITIDELKETYKDLLSNTKADAAAGEKYVTETLRWSVDSFKTVMDLRARLESGQNPQPPKPTDAEWAEMERLLTTAYKQYHLWSDWRTKEDNEGLPYWNLLKAKIPRWRASTEARQAWQQALRARTEPAVIDPDLLRETHFRERGGNVAFDLWRRRTRIFTGPRGVLAGFPSGAKTRSGLKKRLEIALGPFVPPKPNQLVKTGLDKLLIDAKDKAVTSERLDQLCISPEALDFIARMCNLLDQSTGKLLKSEWDDIVSILAQVWKRRQTAVWRDDELKVQVTLSPDWFKIPVFASTTQFPPPRPPDPPSWRGTRSDVVDWEDRLQSRIDQQQGIIDGVSQAVSEVEEITLPTLRDALLLEPGVPGATLSEKADWVTENLLIDAKQSGCLKITRIAQAIETLQQLLWSVRTGLVTDSHPDLKLLPSKGRDDVAIQEFDEAWKWIGSYATWRAAMFVFLYPENILIPSLKGHQTPAFRQLVDDFRGLNRIVPKRFVKAVQDYYEYFNDVCSLKLAAWFKTLSNLFKESESANLYASASAKLVSFLFGLTEKNNLYWSISDDSDKQWGQTYWRKLTGFKKNEISSLLGCTVYKTPGNRRLLYLFALTTKDGEQKIEFLRLDLGNGQWDSESAEVTLPSGDYTSFTAKLQQTNEDDIPTIFVDLPGSTRYRVTLGKKGEREGGKTQQLGVPDTWTEWSEVGPTFARISYAPKAQDDRRYFLTGASVCPVSFGGREQHLYYWVEGVRQQNTKPLLNTAWCVAGVRDAAGSISWDLTPRQIFVLPTEAWPMGFSVCDITHDKVKAPGLIAAYLKWAYGSTDDYKVYYKIGWNLQSDGIPKDVSGEIYSGLSFPLLPAPIVGMVEDGRAGIDIIADGMKIAVATNPDGKRRFLVAIAICNDNPFKTNNNFKFENTFNMQARVLTEAGDTIDPTIPILPPLSDYAIDHVPTGVGLAFTSLVDRAKLDAVVYYQWRPTEGEYEEYKGEYFTGWNCAPDNLRPTRWSNPANVDPPFHSLMAGGTITVTDLNSNGRPDLLIFNNGYYNADPRGTWGNYRIGFDFGFETIIPPENFNDEGIKPVSLPVSTDLKELLPPKLNLPNFTATKNSRNLVYLEEAFYFVPVLAALQLQKGGEYIAALDWFRLVYDYTLPQQQRSFVGLAPIVVNADDFPRDNPTVQGDEYDWLLDPLNPHAIARTRNGTYSRFTKNSIVKCLLDYADYEFTQDTSESIPIARELYMTALQLLYDDELRPVSETCEGVLQNLEIVFGEKWSDHIPEVIKPEYKEDLGDFKHLANGLIKLFDRYQTTGKFLSEARKYLYKSAPAPQPALRLDSAVDRLSSTMPRLYDATLTEPPLANLLERVAGAPNTTQLTRFAAVPDSVNGSVSTRTTLNPLLSKDDSADFVLRGDNQLPQPRLDDGYGGMVAPTDVSTEYLGYHSGWLPVSRQFCVPQNPILRMLRLRANLNLYKIRTCRNISGLKRELEIYAAPTDTFTGLPSIGAGGQLLLPGTVRIQPTPYRYQTLRERAKQLVQLAMQIEQAFLSALEKSDAEAYAMLKAKQDLGLTKAGVTLQDLRVQEAQGGVKLATLQRDRATIQIRTYSTWMSAGLSDLEQRIIEEYVALGVVQAAIGVGETVLQQGSVSDFSKAFTGSAAFIVSAGRVIQAGLQASINIQQILASQERRMEEWALQEALAQQDLAIGDQQIELAEDHVRVTEQERTIANIQAENAQEVVDFLSEKFTTKELYDWMSGVLEGVYSFFLQQATAVAQLAQGQLAFERQETPPNFIQADYWDGPPDNSTGSSQDAKTPDRRGLTGSARLLQDIYQLEQYAFDNDKRKLQLTKTISLAQLDPFAFQQFRETGILNFATPMELFDRDFPGHYLRLIKRVRTSVIALIPPTQGIRATLSSTGLSRVVVGGDIFQKINLTRDPETVALSSPINATGMFDLEAQSSSDMLLPFEGTGVDKQWEFRMLKASNQFDYDTIADVLLTIEYTALNSFDYQQQVIQSPALTRPLSADRPFSFRYQFADAWYDLHNPDQSDHRMTVTFETRREDFPPNLSNPKIQHVVWYVASTTDTGIELQDIDLRFTEQGGGQVGGPANTNDSVVSTRRGNAGPWNAMIGKSVVGQWKMTLQDNKIVWDLFDQKPIDPQKPTPRVADILLVITYSGRTPEWPQ